MFLTKSARIAVALFAVLALIVCEGAWATHAYGRYVAVNPGASVPAGCHMSGDSDVPDSAALSPCDSAQAPSDFFHLPAVTLAVVAVSFIVPAAAGPACSPRDTALRPLSGAPPPLHLLHCRLRN